ncbi:MAG: penicillin-binding transpeptidase domain-containing protein [Lachnospiraceae bacterium]
MKREMLNKNKNATAKIFTLIFFLFIFVLILRLGYLCLTGKVDGINLKSFANKRNTKKETLYALRGNIYDVNGDVLAQTINSYTIIAYLDESRSKDSKVPLHVVNKEDTAEKLATVLDMSKEQILERLNKKAYQVEFGSKGKGLTELQKEAIENLNLSGIDFITTHKRYYPNNNFLSYIIGYTSSDENGNMKGLMGIEKQYDEKMTGTNGFVKYQKDLNGYKFPNSNEIRKEKIDGNDVYLTIDSNVQMSLETAINKAQNESSANWIVAVVADAKTGKILGSATSPSFNPNTKDIKNYLNPLVSYTYEPGSVMKTYSYMAALENNPTWDPYNTNCETGPYEIGDDTVRDWNKTGWGLIPYSRGYTLSSNTCVANMIKNYLSKQKLMDYYKKLGFGQKTNIDLPNEYTGKVKFKYDVEVVNAGFGQGITTTPIQQIKALTAISNNGVILNPYIVSKTVNSSTKEVTYKAAVKEGEKVASTETINKIKDLMYRVVNSDSSETTGSKYKMDGYDLIGKTGTAQIANPRTGKYYDGKYDYITSFSGMYPKDDPKVILYVAFQRSYNSNVLPQTVQTIVRDTAKYLGIFEEAPEINKEVTTYKLGSYKNKTTESVKQALDALGASYVIFGDGNKVISQYPNKNSKVSTKDKVFIFTNGTITMPDLTNYSVKEADVVLSKLGIKHTINASGYIGYQSVSAGTIINSDTEVTLN